MALVALEGRKGEEEPDERASFFDVHSYQTTAWTAQLLEKPVGVFALGWLASETAPWVYVKTLHAKVCEFTLESDFLANALTKLGTLSAKR